MSYYLLRIVLFISTIMKKKNYEKKIAFFKVSRLLVVARSLDTLKKTLFFHYSDFKSQVL